MIRPRTFDRLLVLIMGLLLAYETFLILAGGV